METTRTLHEFSKASDAADLIRSARAVMKTQLAHIAEAEQTLADMGMRLDGDRTETTYNECCGLRAID